MTTETAQQIAPPVPASPLHVGWGYHEYTGIAYLTHDGRIQAWATIKTPNQAARIEGVFQRLTTSHTPY